MKNFRILVNAMIAIVLTSLLVTCQKEPVSPANDSEMEVTFAIGNLDQNPSSMLKSAIIYSLSSAEKAVLTIKNSDGTATRYTSSELDVLGMNGNYYTQKIMLKAGSYKVTEFILKDANGNAIFVSPLAGSLESQNVTRPLPIDFNVIKNVSTPVNMEVLNTDKKAPEDFGLSQFPVVETKVFGFMVGIVDAETFELLSARLTVSSGSYNYVQQLDPITNNVVSVRDSLGTYTLMVEKNGYKTYTHTYSLDSMKLFSNNSGNLPLLVNLKKNKIPTNGLVAYYSFNGNASDLSGNGLNGTPNGITYLTGGKDKVAKFTATSYVNIPDNSKLDFSTASGLSIVTWIRPETASLGNIFSKMGIGELWDDEYGLSIDTDGTLQGGMVQNSLVYATVTSVRKLTLNTWYNVVLMWNKSNGSVSIYINGTLDKAVSSSITSIQNVNVDLRIGRPIPTYINSFLGSIDELRIYNRALSAQEVANIYND